MQYFKNALLALTSPLRNDLNKQKLDLCQNNSENVSPNLMCSTSVKPDKKINEEVPCDNLLYKNNEYSANKMEVKDYSANGYCEANKNMSTVNKLLQDESADKHENKNILLESENQNEMALNKSNEINDDINTSENITNINSKNISSEHLDKTMEINDHLTNNDESKQNNSLITKLIKDPKENKALFESESKTEIALNKSNEIKNNINMSENIINPNINSKNINSEHLDKTVEINNHSTSNDESKQNNSLVTELLKDPEETLLEPESEITLKKLIEINDSINTSESLINLNVNSKNISNKNLDKTMETDSETENALKKLNEIKDNIKKSESLINLSINSKNINNKHLDETMEINDHLTNNDEQKQNPSLVTKLFENPEEKVVLESEIKTEIALKKSNEITLLQDTSSSVRKVEELMNLSDCVVKTEKKIECNLEVELNKTFEKIDDDIEFAAEKNNELFEANKIGESFSKNDSHIILTDKEGLLVNNIGEEIVKKEFNCIAPTENSPNKTFSEKPDTCENVEKNQDMLNKTIEISNDDKQVLTEDLNENILIQTIKILKKELEKEEEQILPYVAVNKKCKDNLKYKVTPEKEREQRKMLKRLRAAIDALCLAPMTLDERPAEDEEIGGFKLAQNESIPYLLVRPNNTDNINLNTCSKFALHNSSLKTSKNDTLQDSNNYFENNIELKIEGALDKKNYENEQISIKNEIIENIASQNDLVMPTFKKEDTDEPINDFKVEENNQIFENTFDNFTSEQIIKNNDDSETSPNFKAIKRISLGHKELLKLIPDLDITNQKLAEPLENVEEVMEIKNEDKNDKSFNSSERKCEIKIPSIENKITEKNSIGLQVELDDQNNTDLKIRELNLHFGQILEEYQAFMMTAMDEKKKLEEDNSILSHHLEKTESAFSDLLQKYDRAKNLMSNYKESEDNWRQKCEQLNDTIKKQDERYEHMKSSARKTIEEANAKYILLKEKYEAQLTSQNAIIRSLEIKRDSLENCLQQKTQECKALTDFVDQFLGKNK